MKNLLYLNKYFIKYKWHLIGGIVFVFLNNIFGTLVAPFTRNVLALILKYKDTYNQTGKIPEAFNSELLYTCSLIIGTALISGLFLYYQRKILIGMSRHIEYELKNSIYSHYQKLPLAFYKQNNTGDLMNRISEDVSQVRMYIGPCIMYFINMIAVFSITIPFMVSVNTTLTLFCLIPLPLLVFSIYFVHNKISIQSEKIQKSQSALSTKSQETFAGIRVTKAFVKENDNYNSFKKIANQYKFNSINLSKINSFFFPLILTLVGASNLLVIYIGGLEVIEGNLGFENIPEFIIYLNRMTWPVTSLGWISSLVRRADVSQKRINEFLDQKSDIISGNNKAENLKGNITFTNVSFTYPNTGITALKNINFSLDAGKTLAVVGNTGSGKTTLIHLITRMYDPDMGEVKIDDNALQTYNTESLRQKIGVVPQEVFLFSDSIENNIHFGNPKPNYEEMIEASKKADLHHNVIQFKDGYQTILGERGITLSGGQKQRLSIARAIIRNPQILILDDALSAVDTNTENNILNALEKVKTNKTTIIVSHRISSVKLADHIIVLNEGEILEQGTHSALLKKEGFYKELYTKQLQENE